MLIRKVEMRRMFPPVQAERFVTNVFSCSLFLNIEWLSSKSEANLRRMMCDSALPPGLDAPSEERSLNAFEFFNFLPVSICQRFLFLVEVDVMQTVFSLAF